MVSQVMRRQVEDDKATQHAASAFAGTMLSNLRAQKQLSEKRRLQWQEVQKRVWARCCSGLGFPDPHPGDKTPRGELLITAQTD